jgi:mono/diheme cytochrome c family protein
VEDANVREIVLDGFNGMPSFRYSFRPAEIDDLMAYLHTLTGKPPEPAAGKGESYFRAYCIRCHNPDSRTAAGPDLRGRYEPAWNSPIEDGHAGAPALKEWLDDAARQALIDYLKTYR